MPNFLIYGANGYSGALIARTAVARGHRPILAGRNAKEVAALAGELQLEHRCFTLTDAATVARQLDGLAAVIHCAGPFAHTFEVMTNACLQARVHYLDITAEMVVFETLAARSERAEQAGVMWLPGAGFDVVPSDCLAAHLKRRLPTANHLALGFQVRSRVSRGTATTVVENLGKGGLIRRDGVLTPVPTDWKTRTIDFGDGPVLSVSVPWGDVATAYHSTGIPNIEVYMAFPKGIGLFAQASRWGNWLLRSAVFQFLAKKWIRTWLPGPTDTERATHHSQFWGEATDADGQRVVSRLRGPEAYTLTAQTAVQCVEQVLAGKAPPGFQTPAKAYGPDFILDVAGIIREDVYEPRGGSLSPTR
ncbi:MAG: saccharopine dehydrogenase family protein [Gemmataceae bacterium]